eukprot:6466843-Amphidinium_carterae.1
MSRRSFWGVESTALAKRSRVQRLILQILMHVWRWSTAAEKRLAAVLRKPSKSVMVPDLAPKLNFYASHLEGAKACVLCQAAMLMI